MTLTVEPTGTIDPNGTATIKHSGTGTIKVTITSDAGQKEEIDVPPSGATWSPPAGWKSATFNAPGCDEVFRWIGTEAEAGGGT